MQAGKLRHRAELQNMATGQDGYGEETQNYATFATVWAAIEPLQGRELEFAQQISAETNHKVTIRYNSEVKATSRIIFGQRTLEVTTVINPKERNRELILMCKEIS